MTKYYVIRIDICPRCSCCGVVIHPAWEQFYSDAEKDPHLKYENWFCENGYTFSSDIPPEEIPCPDCEGKGEIESRVELNEALIQIQSQTIS